MAMSSESWSKVRGSDAFVKDVNENQLTRSTLQGRRTVLPFIPERRAELTRIEICSFMASSRLEFDVYVLLRVESDASVAV